MAVTQLLKPPLQPRLASAQRKILSIILVRDETFDVQTDNPLDARNHRVRRRENVASVIV
jgi:hypothetical protein